MSKDGIKTEVNLKTDFSSPEDQAQLREIMSMLNSMSEKLTGGLTELTGGLTELGTKLDSLSSGLDKTLRRAYALQPPTPYFGPPRNAQGKVELNSGRGSQRRSLFHP